MSGRVALHGRQDNLLSFLFGNFGYPTLVLEHLVVGDHGGGDGVYDYNAPEGGDPIFQFIGRIDAKNVEIAGLHGRGRDITGQHQVTELFKLNHLFQERLQQAIQDDREFKRKYALVFIDIDQLHAINQQMGQFVGDGLLKQMARRLSNAIKESDSAGRLEEDNFALLL